MSRSLLRQLEQIRNSYIYDDSVINVNSSTVAEPTVSGSLEGDLNILRTLLKDVKGTSDWFGDLGNYFDPTNTDATNTETKDFNLLNIKNSTLDANTLLLPVSNDNNSNGYTVSGTSTGVLLSVTTRYATPDNRTGLPIFASMSNTGSYYDEGGADITCMVDLYDMSTGNQFRDNLGNIIYAKFHDGADFGGTGDGSDVYARFYADNNVTDLSTISGTTPSSIGFKYPQRFVMNQLPESWLRREFISGVEGDVELIEDIYNLWLFTGSTNGDHSPQPWNNTTASYLLEPDPDNLKDAVDAINDGIASRVYTQDNYVTDGESITSSIDALDIQLKIVSDGISSSSGVKVIEEVSTTIHKNTPHTLPGGRTYTPDSTVNEEGKNMDVYVNGQLLAADSGVNGANADRDYGETSSTQITFRFKVRKRSVITYVIRQ